MDVDTEEEENNILYLMFLLLKVLRVYLQYQKDIIDTLKCRRFVAVYKRTNIVLALPVNIIKQEKLPIASNHQMQVRNILKLHYQRFRAREGIKIINSINHEVFCTVLNYVHKNMSPEEEDHDERENALEELEKLVSVPRADFLLLIKTLSYILKRTSTFIIKPTKLQHELKHVLKLNEDKVDCIIKLWIKNTKPILDNLETNRTGTNELKDISWKLKIQISSHCQQKEKTALALLQLRTTEGPINLEMNHEELANLYNQLELVQNELDTLRSSK